MKNYPLRVALLYFFIGAAWIFVTDWLVDQIASYARSQALQSYKGLFFVCVTAVLLYFIILGNYRRIKRKELEYRCMFKENPYPMLVYDIETLEVLTINNTFLEKYGYRKNEVVGLRITDIGPPEDELAILDFVKKVGEKGFSDSGIWRQVTKDGRSFYAKISSHPTLFGGRKARIMITMDVDEEMRAKKGLQASERKLQTLIDNSNDYIYMVDPRLCIIDANAAFKEKFRRVTGISAVSLPLDLTPMATSTGWERYYKRALAGEHLQFEEQITDQESGELELHEIVMNPIHDENGQVTGIGCFSRDITLQRKREEQIQLQVAKLKNIAWLQSHELRKSLTNIMMLASLIQEEPDKQAAIKELLPLLQQSCNELDQVVRTIVETASAVEKEA
ncbi:PAS domain S-box protein [Deminuibacter soli]|nr:PAS domain S-box protein [Deminuibacter soli]